MIKTWGKIIGALTFIGILFGVIAGLLAVMLSGCSETPPSDSIEGLLTTGKDALASFAGFHHAPPDAGIEDGVTIILTDFAERG